MNYFYITGTSRGIGNALARLLLKTRTNFVYGISRTCSIEHPNYHHIVADFSNPGFIDHIDFQDHPDAGTIALVNNSGMIGEIVRVGKKKNSDIIQNYQVNIVAPSLLTNSFIAKYDKSKAIRTIINISSGAARHEVDAWGTYCASKSAIDAISKVIKLEQEIDNPNNPIRIFSVAPGIVDTDMMSEIRQASKEDFSDVAKFIYYKEAGKLSTPQDVALHLADLINHPENYKDVILDVRSF